LDLLRGLAALAVCAGHLRGFLFVDYGEITTPGIFDRAFYLATSLGHQAVVVFFVLSGYLVGGSALNAFWNNRWSWQQYAMRRMTRLWVVLIPALLLTLVMDSAGQHLGGAAYKGSLHRLYNSGPSQTAPADLSPSTFLGNLLFLQTIQVPCYGTNGPLWSLANEFWYYALFPLACAAGFGLVRGLGKPSSAAQALLCLTLFLLLLCWLPIGLTMPGLIWLIGTAAFWTARSSKVAAFCRHPAVLTVSGVAAVATLAATKSNSPWGSDYAVGVAFGVWMVGLASKSIMPRPLTRLAGRLSDLSYTLYLVHFPVLAFTFFSFFKGRQFQPAPAGYLVFMALLLGTLAVSTGLWWCFERNTDRVRKRLENLLFPKTTNPAVTH
jgi:peptidoglycan/LPS O-acetylase OafA/YrhL